jgi:hypothetical protein
VGILPRARKIFSAQRSAAEAFSADGYRLIRRSALPFQLPERPRLKRPKPTKKLLKALG